MAVTGSEGGSWAKGATLRNREKQKKTGTKGGVPGMVPPNGWFIVENPNLQWMIWGYAHLRKPPNGENINDLIGNPWNKWENQAKFMIVGGCFVICSSGPLFGTSDLFHEFFLPVGKG